MKLIVFSYDIYPKVELTTQTSRKWNIIMDWNAHRISVSIISFQITS